MILSIIFKQQSTKLFQRIAVTMTTKTWRTMDNFAHKKSIFVSYSIPVSDIIFCYLIVLRKSIILGVKVSNIYKYIIICTCKYDWNNTGYILMKYIQGKHDILQHYSYEVFWKKKYVCLDAWNSKPSLYHSCTSQFIFKWLSLQSKFLKPILFSSWVYQIIYEPECLRTDSSLIKCF